jgi:hypothetical protein
MSQRVAGTTTITAGCSAGSSATTVRAGTTVTTTAAVRGMAPERPGLTGAAWASGWGSACEPECGLGRVVPGGHDGTAGRWSIGQRALHCRGYRVPARVGDGVGNCSNGERVAVVRERGTKCTVSLRVVMSGSG